MKTTGGDFFKSVPEDANAYPMSWILHDSPEREAIDDPPGTTSSDEANSADRSIVLVETVVPERSDFDFSKWLDLQMLVSLEDANE